MNQQSSEHEYFQMLVQGHLKAFCCHYVDQGFDCEYNASFQAVSSHLLMRNVYCNDDIDNELIVDDEILHHHDDSAEKTYKVDDVQDLLCDVDAQAAGLINFFS